MRNLTRFLLGVTVGGVALSAYLWYVGLDIVLARASVTAPWAVALVIGLIIAEGAVDGIGVWASVKPLNGGLRGGQSVQFAFAGDFFDILSPAGPVSSEPIMARFISVTTDTAYSEALGVRSLAKYVKSGTQLVVSGLLVVGLTVGTPDAAFLLSLVGGGLLGLAVVGVVVARGWRALTPVLIAGLTPLVTGISSIFLDGSHDRTTVATAVDQFWTRITSFGETPRLVALIGLGGVIEQVLTAGALWVALAGSGTAAPLLLIVALVPLPQVASVVPVPGSIGAYDILLSGALVVVTGVPAAATAAAVLVVRTVSLPFGLTAGGLSVAFLRGWRPRVN